MMDFFMLVVTLRRRCACGNRRRFELHESLLRWRDGDSCNSSLRKLDWCGSARSLRLRCRGSVTDENHFITFGTRHIDGDGFREVGDGSGCGIKKFNSRRVLADGQGQGCKADELRQVVPGARVRFRRSAGGNNFGGYT